MSSNSKDTHIRILETTWRLLEEEPGKSLSMGRIARETGISRQALYLHFTSRTELLIETTQYVDDVKGFNDRLEQISSAKSGTQKLALYVDIWGNYIPEIYGVAKGLMSSKDNDEAAAAAWKDIMACLRDVCREIVTALEDEGVLSPEWPLAAATDYMWTMSSIATWEVLTRDCGWSQAEYLRHTLQAVNSALVME